MCFTTKYIPDHDDHGGICTITGGREELETYSPQVRTTTAVQKAFGNVREGLLEDLLFSVYRFVYKRSIVNGIYLMGWYMSDCD